MTVEQYDLETERTRFSMALAGNSPRDIIEFVTSRELQRAELIEEIFGPVCAD